MNKDQVLVEGSIPMEGNTRIYFILIMIVTFIGVRMCYKKGLADFIPKSIFPHMLTHQ